MSTVMKVSVDQNPVAIEWPDDLFDPKSMFRVNGNEVPSTGLKEALFDGEDAEVVAHMATQAAVYRSEERTLVVVTLRKPRDKGDTLLGSLEIERPVGNFIPVYIVKRVEQVRVRPWMFGTMARLEIEPTQPLMVTLFQIMKKLGRVPVSMVDRKIFFVKQEAQDEVFRTFGITEDVEANSHLLVRIGVLMKRPGGLQLDMILPEERFSEASNDGTIVISKSMDEPRPGTLQIRNGGAPYYLKGMARPPLELPGGAVEPEGLVSEAQFGRKVQDGVLEGVFVAVRTLPHERCSLNYQAALFGMEDPASFIHQDTQRLKNQKIEDLFSQEERRKIRAGVPPALLMKKYAPWKWLTQFKVKGARATVFGSKLVPVGSVRLLPDTFKRFARAHQKDGETVVEIPDEVVLHRDPAVPNASSMAMYRLEGEISWQGIEGGEGIVINPMDCCWKEAGGDFDGDAAVAFELTSELKETLPAMTTLRQKQGVKLVKFDGLARVDTTLTKMANGFTSRLGPAVMSCRRLHEDSLVQWSKPVKEDAPLTQFEDILRRASCVVQAAVDAKKHPIDVKKGRTMYDQLRDREEQARPKGGYLTDHMHKVRAASDEDNKIKAWKGLVKEAETRPNTKGVVRRMCERVLVLNEMFIQTEWLRGERVVLPSEMQDAALSWLTDIADDAPEQMQLVARLSGAYRRATRTLVEASETGDKDAQALAREVVAAARLALRMNLASGKISPAAMVAYGPHRLAAELVSAKAFERLGQSARFQELVLFGTEWTSGEYMLENLDPIPSCKKKFDVLVEGQEVVKVQMKVLSVGERTTRTVLTW